MFISKNCERVVALQLNDHLHDGDWLEEFQSAYRVGHSTESALLRVHNDVLRAIDEDKCVILLLLDLSAAFDTVDHKILLERLSSRFGISGTVHRWFQSYLSGRKQFVRVTSAQPVVSWIVDYPRALSLGLYCICFTPHHLVIL